MEEEREQLKAVIDKLHEMIELIREIQADIVKVLIVSDLNKKHGKILKSYPQTV